MISISSSAPVSRLLSQAGDIPLPLWTVLPDISSGISLSLSTSSTYDLSSAWIVGIWYGGMYGYGKSASSSYVWPIRSGPPTGAIIINNDATWAKTTAVTLTLGCTDSESGCAEMQISNDGVFDTEPIEPVATSKSWTLVRTIKKKGLSCLAGGASGSFTWEGKDKNGVLVPAGPTLIR